MLLWLLKKSGMIAYKLFKAYAKQILPIFAWDEGQAVYINISCKRV